MNSLCVSEPERNIRWRALFEMDEQAHVRLARLESRVDHIQQDVGEIKAQLVRVDQKIDGVRVDLAARIDSKTDSLATDLGGKIDRLSQELSSMKVWAMGMYIALAGSLLVVIAKGFKWL